MNYLKLLVLFLGLNLIGCTSEEGSNTESNALSFATEKDSLDVLSELFEDMKEENYENMQDYIRPLGVISCYPITIEMKNIFTIEQNKLGETIVNNKIDYSGISDEVVTYFSANRDKNDVINNYPMYSRISKKEIISLTKKAIGEVKEFKDKPGITDDIIEFKERQVEEWVKKLRAIKVLQIDKLSEPSVQAHIHIEYQDTLKGKHLIDSVLVGFYL